MDGNLKVSFYLKQERREEKTAMPFTRIAENEIPVTLEVDHSYTGIRIINSAIEVYISNNQLYVNTSQEEMIYLYTVSGQLEYSGMKPEGMEIIPLRQPQHQVLIVKSSSGWVQKVVR